MKRPIAVVLLGVVVGCGSPPPPQPRPPPPPEPAPLRFDLGALDRTADPCTDFYDYACGGWKKSHPIPPDRSRWSRYAEIEAQSLERVRAIAEAATHAGPSATPGEQRIGAYYAACLDEAGIEARGVAPLHDILARIDAIKAPADVRAIATELQVHHVVALFDAYVTVEPHDAHATTLELDRGALGLPAPGDYTRDDAAALRARYRDHLEKLFVAAGSPEAEAEAERTLAFETSLAAHAKTPVEERDADGRVHPMRVAELGARFPAIAWPAYFAELGAGAVDHVNVAAPAWLDAVNTAIQAPDLAPLRAYLRARVLQKYAMVLPHAFDQAVAEFTARDVAGAREAPPRWKRCLALVDAMIGDDVGRIFLARHFPPEAAQRARVMVDRIRAAFRDDIASLDWMSAGAREAALAKLSKVLVVVGGSNRLRTYPGLVMRADDAFGDTWRARAAATAWDLEQLGKPTDRERFFDQHPQALDAFSGHEAVAVGFTAGFLQPPVFDPAMDDAVNFGGLGGVMGHELSHEFDDEGRKFDVDGNLHPWWSPEDVARFEDRARCFIDEYAGFHAEDGTPLNGKLSLGENLADNGGLRLSHAALRPSDTGPVVDGFTPAQRFFLAWGQIRCENLTTEAEHRRALTDGHAPGRWRVNGVVSNMPEFARAFSCAASTPMAPERRCTLW